MPSYYDLVQEQKGNPVGITSLRTNQSDLDKRMQADADLLHLDDYILKDSDGKAVKGIVNLTLNRPAVFAANVISSLSNARQQVVVEKSEDDKVDTTLIEQFLNAGMSSADRRLRQMGQPSLNPFADVQFCIRGRTARRILLREEKGEVISDIMPWDGRYVYHELGEKGLAWGAYETIRAKEQVDNEYGSEAARKATNNECGVLDVWNPKLNEIWIDGEKIHEKKHRYGFTPIVLQIVTLGYGRMLLDRNWQKYDGESIFFMIRGIVPELNRLGSILQTLNMEELKTALQYMNPEGTPQDEPPDRPEMGDVVSVGKGRMEPINMGQARQAATQLYNMMEKAFQEGSYTDVDIGNVRQPFSAVALITIGENKDMVYLPRLAAKEQLNIDTAEMLIRQAIQLGGTIELGNPGHKQSFATSKLQGEYEVKYKYFTKSPKIDIARMSVASAAEKWYPREYIYEEVLQVEDPKGLLRAWNSQKAELLSPGVERHVVIMALLEEAEKNNDEDAARKAQIMAMEMGVTLDQIRSGQFVEPQKREPQPTEPPLPLLGEGGQVGGLRPNKAASNLMQTPEEEES